MEPIDEQARGYTNACLEKLKSLLEASGKNEPDSRLQFWVARYLLELGHGRSPVRKDGAADDELSDDEKKKLDSFMKAYERHQRKHPREHPEAESPGVLGDGLSRGMAGDGAPEPADA